MCVCVCVCVCACAWYLNESRVDGLRRVGRFELLDLLVNETVARRIDLHHIVLPAGRHEPAGNVQVVDGHVLLCVCVCVCVCE